VHDHRLTFVVYSHVMRGFDNYERNTGQRHPMHPKVAKRDFSSEPLVDEHDNQTGKLWHGIVARLRD
jgi:hypothetical protein